MGGLLALGSVNLSGSWLGVAYYPFPWGNEEGGKNNTEILQWWVLGFKDGGETRKITEVINHPRWAERSKSILNINSTSGMSLWTVQTLEKNTGIFSLRELVILEEEKGTLLDPN